MILSSYQFVGFFAVVLGLFFLVPYRFRWVYLLLASYYFYLSGSASPLLLGHLGLTTLVAYWLGLRVEAAQDGDRKRGWLKLAIVLLAGNLLVFKYTAFANESARAMLHMLSMSYPIPVVHLVLPLGISFYTFQLISYEVDVYKGTVKAERHLGVFAVYVAFFPKLLAGPIERAKSLLPQLHERTDFDYGRVSSGLQLMLWGAFQKVVVADTLGPFVGDAYGDPRSHSGMTMAFATWLFAFQVYCDFAGYTHMAIGAGRTLGYELSPNFSRPYFATSVQDFWKRWHISLTSWLTDYIYTPLTRSKIRLKWYYLMLLSLLLTFVFSGLWHGANWTFVLWGTLHGVYLVFATMTQKARNKFHKRTGLLKKKGLHRWVKVGTVFGLVCFAYILFQSRSVSDAWHIMTHLHTGWGDPVGGITTLVARRWAPLAFALSGALLVTVVDYLSERDKKQFTLTDRPRWVRWTATYVGAVAVMVLGAGGGEHDFIYVQF